MRSATSRALLLALLAVAPGISQTRSLTILHTNDLHAHFQPLDNRQGGFAYLATAIRHEREGCADCMLLNAGDLVQGSPVSTIFHGLPIFEVANLLGFNAATLGNHDFDYGWMQARKFIQTAKYPIVSANLVNNSGELFAQKPYLVLDVNGLRVGVVGAMTDELKTLSTAKLLGPWHTSPMVETVRRYAREIRGKTDLVVLLGHITSQEEVAVLKKVPEVDVVVSGHVHAGLKQELVEGNRLVVRVKGYSEELGRLELKVDTKRKSIESWTWRRIPIDSTKLAAAADVAAAVKKWESEVTKRVDQPLAVSRRKFEKPDLKKLIERAMRDETGADFAFMNGGGVRDILPAGQLLVRNIWDIMPFDNLVVFGKFKGKDLPTVVVGDRGVEPEREYTLAVTDFTASNQGAQNQLRATGLEFPGEGPLLRDLLIDWFRKKQVIE
jgi:5'-nucleotidase / UDP-sugar diphosphatase